MKKFTLFLMSLFLILGNLIAATSTAVMNAASSTELDYNVILSTNESKVYYRIDSYNRGGCLTIADNGTSIQHTEESMNSFWYFTKANEEGGVYINNYSSTKFLGNNITMSDEATVWYILPNGVNEEGLSISSTKPISNSTCIDANNGGTGVGFWNPSASDWNGTTWVFVDINIEEKIAEYEAKIIEYEAAKTAVAEAKSNAEAALAKAAAIETIKLQTTNNTEDGYIWCNEPELTEGPIKNLIDGNTNTFFHTRWRGRNENEHWIQIDLGEGNTITQFAFCYHTRVGVSADFPDAIEIKGSNDGENFTTITTIEDGLPQQPDFWSSDVINNNTEYRYLRFKATAERTYWHMAEFNLYKANAAASEEYSNVLSSLMKLDNLKKTNTETLPTAQLNALAAAINAELELIDNEVAVLNDTDETYTQDTEKVMPWITYKREFEHTEWQALYVPFSIDIEAVKNEFSIARIVQLSEYEDNSLRIRAQVLENGVTEANCPYFIKPKNSGAFTIKVNNTTLKKAESNTLSCETIEWGANFVGVYSPVTNMADEGYYGLANGAFKQASSNSVHLGSYRWYLEIINKKNISSINGVKLYIEREGTTSIEDIDNSIAAPVYYDLSGRRVENPTRGIYIVNGSKVYVK